MLELQGEPCIAFDDVAPPRKGMAVTRSAGVPMTDFDTVFQAITAHATRAAEKLRQHGLVAGTLTVFFHTNRHRPDRPQYAGSRTTRLAPMSSDTLDLVAAARRCAQAAWPKSGTSGYAFTKAGVLLDDLLPIEDRPRTLIRCAASITRSHGGARRGERQVRQEDDGPGQRRDGAVMAIARGSPQPEIHDANDGSAGGSVTEGGAIRSVGIDLPRFYRECHFETGGEKPATSG